MNNLVLSFSDEDLKASKEARELLDAVQSGKRTFDLLGLTYIPTEWNRSCSSPNEWYRGTTTTIHAVISRKIDFKF